jgi:SAM-dependent methyltransferase
MNDSPRLRPDHGRTQARLGDRRASDRLIAHYTLERRLADRLRTAAPADRPAVYGEVYAELFASLADHRQNTAERGSDSRRLAPQLDLIRPLLGTGTRLLELGCGDAAFSFNVAPAVARVYGLDVTDSLVDFARAPANFQFLRTGGTDIPLPDRSVHLAYSNQLMEHLHPDDAEAQLREVRRVLTPGGAYLCITPSRFTGPHDISVYFDYRATGFHLREYDYRSFRRLAKAAGFRDVRYIFGGGRHLPIPYPLAWVVEAILSVLPHQARSRIAQLRPGLLGLTAIVRA